MMTITLKTIVYCIRMKIRPKIRVYSIRMVIRQKSIVDSISMKIRPKIRVCSSMKISQNPYTIRTKIRAKSIVIVLG